MSFRKIAVGTAIGLLVAYAAVRMPAFWDSYQTQRRAKPEAAVDVDVEAERLNKRQQEARVALVRDECGDDDRCSVGYWQAIKAWDACREGHVNLPLSCATDYDSAVARAKAFAGPRTSHEH